VYNVVIDAMDDARARDRAVLVVARQNKLNQETLIATDPEMS
jgi:ribosomal silencing factor RsfS